MAQPTPRFRGRIQDGKICLERREDFAALIARLDGKEISLSLKRWAEQRSSPQNRYYWGAVLPILAEFTGYEVENLHWELKRRFLAIDSDAQIVKVRSTTDLSTVEMTEYIEQIRRMAAEYGCPIPDPNEFE